MSFEVFWNLGLDLMQLSREGSFKIRLRAFREHFGVSPTVCEQIWSRLLTDVLNGAKPLHLLCALYFLKNYNSEYLNQSFSGLSPKSFRKWSWHFIELVAYNLDVVNKLYIYNFKK
jgi:hypothetical protein